MTISPSFQSTVVQSVGKTTEPIVLALFVKNFMIRSANPPSASAMPPGPQAYTWK